MMILRTCVLLLAVFQLTKGVAPRKKCKGIVDWVECSSLFYCKAKFLKGGKVLKKCADNKKKKCKRAKDVTTCREWICQATLDGEGGLDKCKDIPPASPTARPEVSTEAPTRKPTELPTQKPTELPTLKPTESPTGEPTEEPSWKPTWKPTLPPTWKPTQPPTQPPTDALTFIKTRNTVHTFNTTPNSKWTVWHGLIIEVPVETRQVVLAQYQVTMDSKNEALLSKMYLNGGERKNTRSIVGNTKYATNSGFDVFELDAGRHKLDVRYRTQVKINFPYGGGDWRSRTLNAAGLGLGSKILAFLAPTTTFDLSSSNKWQVWNGLSATVNLPEKQVVMAVYQIATRGVKPNTNPGPTSHVGSKLRVDGRYAEHTASLTGNTAYVHNTGVFIGELDAGRHTFETVYRTPSPGIRNVIVSDWQTRSMFVVGMPSARILLNLQPRAVYKFSSANKWTDWAGLSGTITLDKTENILAHFQATSRNVDDTGASTVLSKIFINGKEQRQTSSISGDTKYGMNQGTYMGTLTKGTYTFKVMTRTPGNGRNTPAEDWSARSLVVVAL